MSGRVKIEAVGGSNVYPSIEDTTTSNLTIYLQDGYNVLIPGMEIDCKANCKIYRSSTSPLLRAKFEVVLYDTNGAEIPSYVDSSNIIEEITYQFNNIITADGQWIQFTDNYYYYIADNVVNSTLGDTLLGQINVTSGDTIVHFVDSPITFPNYVSCDYSAFGVKIVITFQAIQNYIPDENGIQLSNTITNSQKIFSDFSNSGLVYTSLDYFTTTTIDGVTTINVKDGVTLPETIVLPLEDADGNLITNINDSF